MSVQTKCRNEPIVAAEIILLQKLRPTEFNVVHKGKQSHRYRLKQLSIRLPPKKGDLHFFGFLEIRS